MSNLIPASDAPSFEIVSMEFVKEMSFEEQKKAMKELDSIVYDYEGFQSREYYYSSENKRWVDLVVWKNLELATKASEKIMKDSRAGEIFSKINTDTMIFSHYNRISDL